MYLDTRALLDSVLYGEPTAERREDARALIARLLAEIEHGEEPPEVFPLLRHAFTLILEGKSADEAFGLKEDRRKQTARHQERDMRIAAYVVLKERQILARGRVEGARSALSRAKGDAANRFCADGEGDGLVEDAYLAHRGMFSLWSDDELEEFVSSM